MSNNYELVLMTRSDLSEQQNNDYIEKVSKVIKTDSGKISRQEYWGLRVLAYRIGKNRRAHYSLFNYSAPPTLGDKLVKKFNLDDEVIRSMIIRTKDSPKEASLMMKPVVEEGATTTDDKVVRRRERQGPSTWKPGQAADDTRSRLVEKMPSTRRRNDDKFNSYKKDDATRYVKKTTYNSDNSSQPSKVDASETANNKLKG